MDSNTRNFIFIPLWSTLGLGTSLATNATRQFISSYKGYGLVDNSLSPEKDSFPLVHYHRCSLDILMYIGNGVFYWLRSQNAPVAFPPLYLACPPFGERSGRCIRLQGTPGTHLPAIHAVFRSGRRRQLGHAEQLFHVTSPSGETLLLRRLSEILFLLHLSIRIIIMCGSIDTARGSPSRQTTCILRRFHRS